MRDVTKNEVFGFIKRDSNTMLVGYKFPTDGIWSSNGRCAEIVASEYSANLGISYERAFTKCFFELLIQNIVRRYSYNVNDIRIEKPISDNEKYDGTNTREVYVKSSLVFKIEIQKEWIYSKKVNIKIYDPMNRLIYSGVLLPKKTYYIENVDIFTKSLQLGYFEEKENIKTFHSLRRL